MPTATLDTILVEESFLLRLSQAQFNSDDKEMLQFVQLARSNDPNFRIIRKFTVDLLARQPQPDAPFQLVIPSGHGFRQLLMEELHNTVTGAHLGARKLTYALFARVWWPKLRDSVSKFIAACDVCKKTKDSTAKPTGLLHPLPIPTSRFTSWSMDFVTDFPLAQGFNAIFVCVDRLTKFTKLIPCFMGENSLTAEHVALLFFHNVVRHFGIPTSVIHDRDPRFTSDFWQSLWKLLGSRAIATSAHHPQADGQTERMNRTIGQILRAHLLADDQEHWPNYVAVTEMAINSTVNASIQKAPFEVLYGENIPLPIDLLLSKESTIDPTAKKFATKMHNLVQQVKNAMADAQQAQKRFYDRKHQHQAFKEGDMVLLSTKNLQLPGIRKLQPRFVGPFRVISTGPETYQLELPPSMATVHPWFHTSLLKPAGSQPTGPPAVEEDYYEVEAIIKLNKRGTHAKIKWLGYDDSHN